MVRKVSKTHHSFPELEMRTAALEGKLYFSPMHNGCGFPGRPPRNIALSARTVGWESLAPAAVSSAWAKRRTRIFPTADGSSPLSLFRARNNAVSSLEQGK